MQLSAPIYFLKRKAKQLSRAENIPLHRAQNSVARDEGFQSWSHLAATHKGQSPAHKLYASFATGDLIVLAARPGHGKTLLGLELAIEAFHRGRTSLFFTLDFTERDVQACFAALGLETEAPRAVEIDTSDAICADYIATELRTRRAPHFVVVDYLQLLDQSRSHPPLDRQLDTLREVARETGAIIAAMSQIDRAFEGSGRQIPDWCDLRLPNPIDLEKIDKGCFLHDGEMVLRMAG
ncbi:MAG: DNA helicase [Pseudomonadota bacterium]